MLSSSLSFIELFLTLMSLCCQVANGGSVKLGSTHGRPLVTIATLSGDKPPPEAPRGQCEVVDLDGTLVRPGARMAPRRSSAILATASAVMGGSGGHGGGKEAKCVPPEIREIKAHWHKVVLHQGWLLKKGGVGLDVIATKSWIKRYFVLYATSQVRTNERENEEVEVEEKEGD